MYALIFIQIVIFQTKNEHLDRLNPPPPKRVYTGYRQINVGPVIGFVSDVKDTTENRNTTEKWKE